jgi:cell division topological specificity factor
MSFFGFSRRRRSSAPVARERLQILLEYERAPFSQSNLFALLKEEILAVINRHVPVDPEKVEIKVDRADNVSTLAVNVEIPSAPSGAMSARLHETFHGERTR